MTSLKISASPAAYLRPEILIPRDPMLEDLPAQVGVESIEDGIGVMGQGKVVGQDELHPANNGVKAIGLGTTVLAAHEVGVVHDLRDLSEHEVVLRILLEKGFEGGVIPVVGEPGAHDVEELCLLGRLRRVLEEGRRLPRRL